MSALGYLKTPFTDVDQKVSTAGLNMPALDGLRGLAALIVLLSHTGALWMQGQGSLGVLLFYFLSGFVLILPFSERPRRFRSWKSVGRFFVNRIFRIVPAYILFVSITCWVIKGDLQWFLWNVSFLKGWLHFWSVASEVRFYLLLPLVILLLGAIPWRVLQLAVVGILILISYRFRGLHLIDMMNGGFAVFYFYVFLSGVFTCLLVRTERVRALLGRFRRYYGFLALAVVIAFFVSSDLAVSRLWPKVFPFIADGLSINGWAAPQYWVIAFFLLFVSVSFYGDGLARKIIESFALRNLGLLSYGIYLGHIAVLMFLQKLGVGQAFLFPLVFLVSYLLAYLSYLLVERPFLILKKRIFDRAAARQRIPAVPG